MAKWIVLPLCLVVATLQGCAGLSFVSHGVPFASLYADAQMNEKVTENGAVYGRSAKTGEACATSILGWIVTGDASLAKAADEAGIKKIAVVDHKYTNILGAYAKYCLVVVGE